LSQLFNDDNVVCVLICNSTFLTHWDTRIQNSFCRSKLDRGLFI